MPNATLDVITFEVMSARLDGIVREMENAVFRTGFSTIVRESHDFSCGVLDASGRLVARGSHPGHMGGLPACVEGLLAFHPPGGMREGDAYLVSHPYYSGCPHANDMAVMTPVFAGGALAAFAASIGHTPDIGGVAAGSRNATARDLFGEGLQIPPIRFMRDYRIEQDAATFVRANSRVPEMMIGDLAAKAGVCHVIGEARLRDLARAYGADALQAQFAQAGERSARRLRERIAAWPDGVSEVEAWCDDPSADGPIRVHAAAVKEGERLVLDFTGAGDQASAPINLRPPFVEGLARNMAIRLTDRHIPLNYGIAEAVECRFRRGSLLDPVFPGPVGFYSKTLALAESVIGAALAKASGNPALAHIATQSSIVVGYAGGGKRQYVQYELMYAGAPGWEGGDGFSGVGSRASYGARFTPVEVIESEFPVEMTRFEVLPDSGGDGAFRGGPGYVREYRVRAPARLSGGAARREAAGVDGGGGGRNAYVVVHPGEEREGRYPGIVSNVGLEPGDVFRVETGGGGGVLPPAGRDPARVRADLDDGVITPAKARETYGAE